MQKYIEILQTHLSKLTAELWFLFWDIICMLVCTSCVCTSASCYQFETACCWGQRVQCHSHFFLWLLSFS